MLKSITPLALLVVANFFMTFAWYAHLKDQRSRPVVIAILISWGVAFFEYCIQVPANRMGIEHYSLPQLKILQEIITLIVFSVFAVFYMKVPITRNFLYASACMVGAAYFIFRD